MSFDTSKLFGVETKDAKPEKKPTITQFIKRTKEPKNKPISLVEVVWLPGKFDNFTLVTDSYRVIISSKHPFYNLLSQFFGDSSTAETAIGVRITSWTDGSYCLEEPKNCSGLWQELGSTGYRFVRD